MKPRCDAKSLWCLLTTAVSLRAETFDRMPTDSSALTIRSHSARSAGVRLFGGIGGFAFRLNNFTSPNGYPPLRKLVREHGSPLAVPLIATRLKIATG